MLCSHCHERSASVHFTIIINGSKTEIHLCDSCAHESAGMDFSQDDGFILDSLLTGMFSEKLSLHELCHAEEDAIICPVCGSSLHDIALSGRIGCSECFNVFSSSLKEIIRNIQGTSEFDGKRPSVSGVTGWCQEVALLKKELEKAVRVENYEQAAVLRDRILDIEREEGSHKAELSNME